MSNEISPLASVQEKIQDKIKAEFVNLIPDEMWSSMVNSVIDDFTNDVKLDSYGRRDQQYVSPIKKMIRAEIDAMAQAAVKAELERLGAGHWDSMGRQVAGEAMKTLVAEHFNDILASVQSGMVNMAVFHAVNQMRQSMMR